MQNGFKPNRIIRIKLNRTLDHVAELTVLRKLNEREEIAPPEKLKEPIILALPLL